MAGLSRRQGRKGEPVPGATPRLRVISERAYPDWEAVYRDNVGRIYALMFGKVGNRADAEDLTSEVFLTALRPLRTEASVAEVRAYLSVVARTTLAAYWRRTLGRPVTAIDEDHAPLLDSPPAEARARALAQEILSGLPERYERVLRLRFLDGYSLADISAAMGISDTNARVLLFRALRRAGELAERGQP